ncbi:MAG: hypothetical protein DRN30_01525 [Thermoplasmata archaeon]|nr:MAG: hypothetical protein DRN30_01525 [Thermoplasmata archaeon]
MAIVYTRDGYLKDTATGKKVKITKYGSGAKAFFKAKAELEKKVKESSAKKRHSSSPRSLLGGEFIRAYEEQQKPKVTVSKPEQKSLLHAPSTPSVKASVPKESALAPHPSHHKHRGSATVSTPAPSSQDLIAKYGMPQLETVGPTVTKTSYEQRKEFESYFEMHKPTAIEPVEKSKVLEMYAATTRTTPLKEFGKGFTEAYTKVGLTTAGLTLLGAIAPTTATAVGAGLMAYPIAKASYSSFKQAISKPKTEQDMAKSLAKYTISAEASGKPIWVTSKKAEEYKDLMRQYKESEEYKLAKAKAYGEVAGSVAGMGAGYTLGVTTADLMKKPLLKAKTFLKGEKVEYTYKDLSKMPSIGAKQEVYTHKTPTGAVVQPKTSLVVGKGVQRIDKNKVYKVVFGQEQRARVLAGKDVQTIRTVAVKEDYLTGRQFLALQRQLMKKARKFVGTPIATKKESLSQLSPLKKGTKVVVLDDTIKTMAVEVSKPYKEAYAGIRFEMPKGITRKEYSKAMRTLYKLAPEEKIVIEKKGLLQKVSDKFKKVFGMQKSRAKIYTSKVSQQAKKISEDLGKKLKETTKGLVLELKQEQAIAPKTPEKVLVGSVSETSLSKVFVPGLVFSEKRAKAKLDIGFGSLKKVSKVLSIPKAKPKAKARLPNIDKQISKQAEKQEQAMKKTTRELNKEISKMFESQKPAMKPKHRAQERQLEEQEQITISLSTFSLSRPSKSHEEQFRKKLALPLLYKRKLPKLDFAVKKPKKKSVRFLRWNPWKGTTPKLTLTTSKSKKKETKSKKKEVGLRKLSLSL